MLHVCYVFLSCQPRMEGAVGEEEASPLLSCAFNFELDGIIYFKQPCKVQKVCCCLLILCVPLCSSSSPIILYVFRFYSSFSSSYCCLYLLFLYLLSLYSLYEFFPPVSYFSSPISNFIFFPLRLPPRPPPPPKSSLTPPRRTMKHQRDKTLHMLPNTMLQTRFSFQVIY